MYSEQHQDSLQWLAIITAADAGDIHFKLMSEATIQLFKTLK